MSTRIAPARHHRDLSRFALVGLIGLGVNQIVLALLTEALGLHYLISAIAATLLSSTSNFIATERWVFRSRRPINSVLREAR